MSGKVTSGERRRRQIAHLVARDGAWCHWCFAVFLDPQAEATRDHLIPRSRGGGNHIGNLVLACSDCNQARGAPEFDAALVELFVARGWAARDPA